MLGVLFLVGQALAWRELKAAGVFVATNPSSSFFYVLTAAHALHICWAAWRRWCMWMCRRCGCSLGPAKRTAIDVTAVFWHFLDGLWIYLMILFYVWG